MHLDKFHGFRLLIMVGHLYVWYCLDLHIVMSEACTTVRTGVLCRRSYIPSLMKSHAAKQSLSTAKTSTNQPSQPARGAAGLAACSTRRTLAAATASSAAAALAVPQQHRLGLRQMLLCTSQRMRAQRRLLQRALLGALSNRCCPCLRGHMDMTGNRSC